VGGVDEGAPIAYEVLEEGVPVLDRDGVQVGTVFYVLSAPREDIFHGIVVDVPDHGRHVVEAADIAAIHERGVDLRVGAEQVREAPAPHGGAGVFRDDSTAMTRGWAHLVSKLTLHRDWKRGE
jgi:hypothetical protein